MILDNDSAITDHFNGCCICNTRSRRCSSSDGAHAVGNAFLVLAEEVMEDDPIVVGVRPPLIEVTFLIEGFDGDSSEEGSRRCCCCCCFDDGLVVELCCPGDLDVGGGGSGCCSCCCDTPPPPP